MIVAILTESRVDDAIVRAVIDGLVQRFPVGFGTLVRELRAHAPQDGDRSPVGA
jgi:hypothetical protein